MATPLSEKDFSPLDSVLQYIPPGHDKALKQALYNAAATVFAVVVCCTAVAVYHILEVFLKPLLWAVLCGTFLHPLKHTLTYYVTIWLQSLRESHTPLLVGGAFLPFKLLDKASESISLLLLRKIKLITFGSIGLLCLYFIFQLLPFGYIISCFMVLFYLAYDALGYFHALWVWTIALAYFICVFFFSSNESVAHLKRFSLPVWILILFHIVSYTGPFRGLLLFALVILMIIGFLSEVSDQRKNKPNTADSPASQKENWTSRITKRLFSLAQDENKSAEENESYKASSSTALPDTSTLQRPTQLPLKEGQQEPSHQSNPKVEAEGSKLESKTTARSRKLSDQCFIVLFWAVLLAQIWRRLWLLNLVPVLILFAFIKKLGLVVGSIQILREKFQSLWSAFSESNRLDLLMPKPVRGLAKLLLRGDGKIVAALEGSMDKFMSILTVLLLLVGMVLVSFFMVVQIHRESMHLLTLTSNVVNSTVHPELSQWLPDNETMQTTIDSMVGNAYVYGREYIANKVHALVSERSQDDQLERQLLEVYDQLYKRFFARNVNQTTEDTVKPALMRGFSMDHIDISNITSLWNIATKHTEGYDLDIWSFVQENIGVFMSVMESVWAVLRSNLSLLLNLLAAMLSVLLGGGTAIFNFIIAAIIFITTLFYLLAASGDTYLPVVCFSSLTPTTYASQTTVGGNRFGTAVEQAISSVFLASLKMAAFYGLYTHFTHTLFGIQMVYIPAALASVFAAVPFVGTYWASVPAVIELWLVHGEGILAAIFFALHMLPSYFVDTAIYSDIKGGHPYLTGLAIAGGMYWLGLEGAIIGPIVLACLVVAVNMYSTMIQPDITAPIEQ